MTLMFPWDTSDPLPPKGLSGWWQWLILLLLGLAVVAASMVVNYNFSVQNPGGNDFAMRWLETRIFFLEGLSPYSDEASLAAQEMIHGHPAEPGQDRALFTYPIYTTIIFAPFSLVSENYAVGRAIWMTTLELSLILLAFIGMRLAGWKLSIIGIAGVLLFSLLWYHSIRPLINGNVAILVALFVSAGLLALRAERDILAGVLLSFSTIKPQAVVLLIALILLWAFSLRRWRLIAGFLGSLTFLILLGMLFVPTWLIQNVEQILSYSSYTPPGTPAAIFESWLPGVGQWLGLALTILLVVILLWHWRFAWGHGFAILLPTAYMTLAITNLVGITTAASNYVLLLPAVILTAAALDKRYQRWGGALAAYSLLGLLVGLWLLFWTTLSGNFQNHILLFPLPVIVLVSMILILRQQDLRKVH
jgi:hypothetical protein